MYKYHSDYPIHNASIPRPFESFHLPRCFTWPSLKKKTLKPPADEGFFAFHWLLDEPLEFMTFASLEEESESTQAHDFVFSAEKNEKLASYVQFLYYAFFLWPMPCDSRSLAEENEKLASHAWPPISIACHESFFSDTCYHRPVQVQPGQCIGRPRRPRGLTTGKITKQIAEVSGTQGWWSIWVVYSGRVGVCVFCESVCLVYILAPASFFFLN